MNTTQEMPREATEPHALLGALDALVRKDRGTTRLSGLVVVAVKGDLKTTVWHAALGRDRVLGCGFSPGVPADADAVLLFTQAQADSVLQGCKPDSAAAICGDIDLLEGFVERFCTFRSMVDIRSSGDVGGAR